MKKLKLICLSLALIFLLAPFAACDNKKDEGTEKPTTTEAPAPSNAVKFTDIDFSEIDSKYVEVSDTETDYVTVKVRNFGDIVIRLYPDVAPKTVENFKKLVSEKFYDGLIFHRVIENFMIQGGDPKGDGTGGSGQDIKGEFTSNGFENNLLHKRGVVSMARSNAPDSASSQFFIVHKTSAHLDGQYAAFGFVVSGMDVVDRIAKVRTDNNDKPVVDVKIESIRFAKISDAPSQSSPEAPKAPKLEDIDLSDITDISTLTVSESATDYVLLDVENYGKILIRLFPDVAPETVANFKKLVGEGFYDGLIFHRVIKDFIIQGGDPLGTGYGGSDATIKGEFSDNGFENNLLHKRGVVSMARKTAPDTASSQFFIVHADYPSLNGKYAAFGYVVYGMDTVDKIANAEVSNANKPVADVKITSAKFVNV